MEFAKPTGISRPIPRLEFTPDSNPGQTPDWSLPNPLASEGRVCSVLVRLVVVCVAQDELSVLCVQGRMCGLEAQHA